MLCDRLCLLVRVWGLNSVTLGEVQLLLLELVGISIGGSLVELCYIIRRPI